VHIRAVPAALIALASLLVVIAGCGDDGDQSSGSAGGAGSTAAAGETADGSGATGSGGSDTTSGAPTTDGTTTDATTVTNAVVPDAQATSGLVQTAVQMRFLAASVQAGEATDAAFQGVLDSWDVYDGTIQKNDPAQWQTMNEALTSMQRAVTAKDGAGAEAAAAMFEAGANGYLGSA
jgi:hypothetical protein